MLPIPARSPIEGGPQAKAVAARRRSRHLRARSGWRCRTPPQTDRRGPHPSRMGLLSHELLAFDLDGVGEVGIVGCAVGAPFAVLVAEQLFASGCRLLISVTSAGQITPIGPTPYFVLIDRAIRDEGTSYHYLPGSTFAEAPDASLLARVEQAGRAHPDIALHWGTTWTTDAPYRETESAIARARDLGTLAVEMEAAALYAFSASSGHSIVCFAHVTNAMAQSGGLREGRG